jgi:hypothetical protein
MRLWIRPLSPAAGVDAIVDFELATLGSRWGDVCYFIMYVRSNSICGLTEIVTTCHFVLHVAPDSLINEELRPCSRGQQHARGHPHHAGAVGHVL